MTDAEYWLDRLMKHAPSNKKVFENELMEELRIKGFGIKLEKKIFDLKKLKIGIEKTMLAWQPEISHQDLDDYDKRESRTHETEKVIGLTVSDREGFDEKSNLDDLKEAEEIIGREIIGLKCEDLRDEADGKDLEFYESRLILEYPWIIVSKSFYEKVNKIMSDFDYPITLEIEPKKAGTICTVLLYLRYLASFVGVEDNTRKFKKNLDYFRKKYSGFQFFDKVENTQKKLKKSEGDTAAKDFQKWRKAWLKTHPDYQPLFTMADYEDGDFTMTIKCRPAYNLWNFFKKETGKEFGIKAMVGRLYAEIGLLPSEQEIIKEITKKAQKKRETLPDVNDPEKWKKKIDSEYSEKITQFIKRVQEANKFLE